MTLAALGAIVFFLTVQALLSSGPDVKKVSSLKRSRIAGKKKVNAFKDGLKILLSMIKLFFKY